MDTLEENKRGEAPPASPFHAGEQEVQQRLGVRDFSEEQGRRSIRDFMPDQHREFFTLLPFLLVGAIDRDGWPLATIVTGRPGFVHSPDPRLLRIAAHPAEEDPVAEHLVTGRDVGLLGIDLATRRRNRMNGRILSSDHGGFSVAVGQSFGNCPQYIQGKRYQFVRAPQFRNPTRLEKIDGFGPTEQALVTRTDAFFVATSAVAQGSARSHGVDISHRGGKPGFVGVRGGRIVVPDYAGNRFYNTLGNLAVDPRAGLLFVDFESGDLLYLAGHVTVTWDGEDVEAYRGAERLWTFRFSHGWWLRDVLPLRWSAADIGPRIGATGTWAEALSVLEAQRRDREDQPYRVARIVEESRGVRSLYLAPVDGRLPHFEPGQFLPIRTDGAGGNYRTYTISSAPGERQLRITVKRGVGFSRRLHEAIDIGDVLQAQAPRGNFVAGLEGDRPLILMAAGIGVTPMVSMLRAAGVGSAATKRSIFLIHAVRNDEIPFADELAGLAATSDGTIRVHYFVTAPSAAALRPKARLTVGRPTPERLEPLLPKVPAEYYLCGPGTFMQSMYDCLRSRGVPDSDIYAEAFGPSSLRRQRTAMPSAVAGITAKVDIIFTRSRKRACWSAGGGALLDLAEAAGIATPSGCRSGACGACETRILSGKVRYLEPPLARLGQGTALICCAVPDCSESDGSSLTLDL